MICDKLDIDGITFENRVVFQPMEGCDCNEDGAPGELTRKKYETFFESGAGTVWMEANAVTAEGRTNPRQMFLHEKNADAFKRFLSEMKELALKKSGFAPKVFLQLTHSGRQSMTPMILYRNPVYETARPLTDENIVSDEYLDALPEKFAASARLAQSVGFDGVDVKSCHGYLLQEALSAYGRKGKYGGDFAGRTRLMLSCVDAVHAAVGNGAMVVSRLGVSDMVPKPYGFGTDEHGNIELGETVKLIKELNTRGVKIVNVTIGNPYYNPHINRPFRAGPYRPDETPQAGVKRFYETTKFLKHSVPEMYFVQSGFTFYGKDMIDAAEKQLTEGVCDFAGFGRQTLAYPQFYADWKNGKFDGKKCCATCSRCTSLMRHKQCAGCAIYNTYYKDLYREKIVCEK